MRLESFVRGQWVAPGSDTTDVRSAVTGDVVAQVTGGGLDMGEVLAHGRTVGGPNLRRLTFHQRAELLKRLAQYLSERKDRLYTLSFQTGATRSDNFIDMDGGIATLFVYASKGRRELPNATFLIDGDVERLSRGGTFVGQHVAAPLHGVAVHINAFNFPCWGLLEKMAPAILAGVPVVTKPATITSYVAHALVRLIAESNILPEGRSNASSARPAICSIISPARTWCRSRGPRTRPRSCSGIRLSRASPCASSPERDSLNAAILAPDAGPGTPEFDLFIKEVAKEMTVKAGQKCTAIRRAIAPSAHVEAVIDALGERLSKVKVGNPELETVRMGPVVGLTQRRDVLAQVAKLRARGRYRRRRSGQLRGRGRGPRARRLPSPLLLHCRDPIRATNVHSVEAFGPVCTVMGYGGLDQAVALANRGDGSLVASLYTYDPAAAADLVFGVGAFHGRLVLVDRDCAKEQTGHGSPMPHLVHGGPGRAGGGEELGGIRGVHHYMQRTALQGSPAMLSTRHAKLDQGRPDHGTGKHPFRYHFEDLAIGQTFVSKERTVTLEDIEHFAAFTGDTFYAHMSEEATKDHPFFPGRVAHGYLLLSFAAGLFVDPDLGPVLANYGLDSLRFLKPVQPGENVKVRLTVKEKSPRNEQYGEVRWDVEIQNGQGETVATYDLLTMNAVRP